MVPFTVKVVASGIIFSGVHYADFGHDDRVVLRGTPVNYSGAYNDDGIVEFGVRSGRTVRATVISNDEIFYVMPFMFTPADINMDGDVDVNDLLHFLGVFRADPSYDYDGDGIPQDVNDILAYLGNFRFGNDYPLEVDEETENHHDPSYPGFWACFGVYENGEWVIPEDEFPNQICQWCPKYCDEDGNLIQDPADLDP